MSEYAIIPRPALLKYQPGSFQCSGLPLIADNGEVFQNEGQVFAGQLRCCFGEAAFAAGSPCIRLRQRAGDAPHQNESYCMAIDSQVIDISSASGAGIYRGLQTLRQLLLSGCRQGACVIPCGIIEDTPRFPWRGFMLDCSRYFYSVEFIKKLLDALSLHHINIFHWHLTDDQGWRFPVRRYPLLAEIGSKRRDHRHRNRFTGGFYTEEEIQDIVSFAACRHIEVVPEVDFPGHASAILAAYPGLGCTGGPYRVEDRFGVFDDVLCAGGGLFPLAEAVFDTLGELFPSRYVHIGGDEVRFGRWAECPKCQKQLAALGLSSPKQLQSWITSRLAAMLRERGKTAIGWDEVLEHSEQFPLPDDLIVMSWRGREGGDKAAALGHRVIMTPNSEGCYLDYKHSDSAEEPGQIHISTLAQGFNLNPIASGMDEKAAALVLGGQGNLWSELIYAGKIAEYMIFPRICALAESLWSKVEAKDFEEFRRRLVIHQSRLDLLGLLQYRGWENNTGCM